MNTSHPSILFLGGAGLPAWIWDDVRRRLSGSHETRVAPRPVRSGAGVRDYADAAIGSMAADRFVVVAHSAGGVVGAEVMRLAPERVAGFLGVCAVVPQAGGSFITAMPVPNRWMLSAVMRLAGTRPPESAIRKILTHGLDDHVTDRLIADFNPEPQGYYRERIGEQSWKGMRGYAATTNDRELPAALQRQFAANLGVGWQHELSTGHLPMLENPEALTATITTFLNARTGSPG